MSWRDVLTIGITDSYGLTIKLGPLFLLLVALGAIGLGIYHVWHRRHLSAWSVVEGEVQLGGLGKVKIRPSYEDIQVAHKAWVELITRKAALPFEPDHDVICQVYDSWYALFQEMRNLTKTIPAERIRTSKDTRELLRLLVDALNEGLRPHLTRWQARFRHWYDKALEENIGKSPQEIQRAYPQYQELVSDLTEVNKQLVNYAEFIRKIAHGQPAR